MQMLLDSERRHQSVGFNPIATLCLYVFLSEYKELSEASGRTKIANPLDVNMTTKIIGSKQRTKVIEDKIE